MKRLLSSILVPVFLTLTADAALPQEGVPAVRAEVEVSIVNLDVVVLDAAGRPVPGLTAADFHILDDGSPVETANALAARLGPVEPAAAAPSPSGPNAASPSDQAATSVVVFVDTSASSVTQRNAVLQEIQPVLESRLTTGQIRVMVVSGDLGIHVEQPFTTDRALFVQALQKAAKGTGGGGLARSETSMVSRLLDNPSIGKSNEPDDSNTGIGQTRNSDAWKLDANFQLEAAKAAAQASYERTRAFLKTLDSFVGSLGGVPGRKMLLWIGEGLQLRPGESLMQKWDSGYGGTEAANPKFSPAGEASRLNLSREFEALLRRANESRVHIVSINSSRGTTGANPSERGQAESIKTTEILASEKISQEQTLAAMGAATGGSALLAGELTTRLGDAMSSLEGAYSLGFPDKHPGDGKYHKVTVTVSRPGLVVHHPAGYLDQSLDERATQACHSALYLDRVDNPLEISVVVKSSTRSGKNEYSVVLLVVIPIGNLVLHPGGEAHQGELALWLASRDETGTVRESARVTTPVRVPNANLASSLVQSAGYTFRLTVPPGSHRAAVSVLDLLGHVSSAASVDFVAGGEPPATKTP
jgi:VWFA-related protein